MVSNATVDRDAVLGRTCTIGDAVDKRDPVYTGCGKVTVMSRGIRCARYNLMGGTGACWIVAVFDVVIAVILIKAIFNVIPASFG